MGELNTEQNVPPIQIKRDYDIIDLAKLREEFFIKTKNEIKELVQGLEREEGVKCHLFEVSNTKFTCRILNKTGQDSKDSFVAVTMSDGITGISDFSIEFKKTGEINSDTNHYDIVAGKSGPLLREVQLFDSTPPKVGNPSQLATEIVQQLLKLSGIA